MKLFSLVPAHLDRSAVRTMEPELLERQLFPVRTQPVQRPLPEWSEIHAELKHAPPAVCFLLLSPEKTLSANPREAASEVAP